MKKVRYFFIAIMAMIGLNVMATEWVIDFNQMTTLPQSWSKTDTEEASDAGDILSETKISDETNNVQVTISPADESARYPNRFWRTNNGPQLRMYSGTLVISGITAKTIVFDAASKFDITPNEGTLNGKTWTNSAGSSTVTFTVNGNTQINKITVSDQTDSTTPDTPDPTPTGEVKEGTCEDIMAAADGEIFRVTGTCIEIKNATFGNWMLQDATGEIYIYGTLDAQGNTKNFSSLGIEVGDIVTVEGPKKTHNETVELVDVKVIKIVKGEGNNPVDPQPVTGDGTVFDFDANGTTLLGLPGESSGSGESAVTLGDITEAKTATVGAFNITISAGVPNEEGNVATPNRLWNKAPKLRLYSGTLTVSSATDDIKTIVFTLATAPSSAKWGEGNTASTGTIDASAKTSVTWTGNAREVVFSIAKNTQISQITINGDAGNTNPDPQPVTNFNVTVTEALALINALDDGAKTTDQYTVKGYIVSIDEISTDFGNATFDIADEKGGQAVLKVYRCKGLGGEKITDANLIKIDDFVEVKGLLQKYVKNDVTTPELAQNGQIVSINGETSGIQTVNNVADNAVVYNLAGQQISARPKDACYPLGRRTLATKGTQERDARNLKKGLYIVNGRKFIVK